MADKAIYSVDTVTSMSGTDKVYVNTGNNIKQITKNNLCGNDIDTLSGDIETLKTEVNNNTNAISDINDNLDNLKHSDVAGGKNLAYSVTYGSECSEDSLQYNVHDIWGTNALNINCNLKANVQYIMSLEAKVSTNDNIYIIYNYEDGTKSQPRTLRQIGTSFESFTIDIFPDKNTNSISIGCNHSDYTFSIKKTVQVEEGTIATDYEPYIPSVKMLADDISHINDSLSVLGKCKNLLKLKIGNVTQTGITLEVDNGKIHVYGTSTENTFIHIADITLKKGVSYKLCSQPFTQGNVYLINGTIYQNNVYTPSKDESQTVVLNIWNGQTVDFYITPMITTNINATYDDFVPYTGDEDTLTADVAKIKNDMTWKRVARVTTTSTDDVISVLPDTWKEVMVDIEDTTTSLTDNCYARSVFTIYRECVTYNGNNYFRTGYSNLVVNITGNHSIKISEMNSGTAVTIYYRN